MYEAVIRLRPPYDFARSIRFWQRSTGELCEHWADGVYRRVVALGSREAVLTLRNVGTVEAPAVAVELDGAVPSEIDRVAVAPLVRQLLGNDLELGAFYAAVADDPPLVSVCARLYGVRAPRSPLWETLCWTIAGQQISVAFAYRLKERLVTRYGDRYTVGEQVLFRFPPPERLAAADPGELMAMQFSGSKASFLIGLAEQIAGGGLDLDAVAQLPTEAAIEHLIRFRGVGRWTAEFALMRGLGRVDALPAADAGVRQGIMALYGVWLEEPALRAFATRWGGWEGAVALYLLGWLREERIVVRRQGIVRSS